MNRPGLAEVKIVKGAITLVAILNGRWLKCLVTVVGISQGRAAAESALQLANMAAFLMGTRCDRR